jgi:beta-lactamase superfamily II metal-dependent hydrolase
MKKYLFYFILFLVLFSAGCKIPLPPETNVTPHIPSGGAMKVHFIDVGQADSILIQTPDGKNMVIDAGNNPDGKKVVSYLEEQGVKKIDVLIGTHPDGDHIGGLDTVIKAFDVGKIYMPKVSKGTKTFKDVLSAIKNKGLKVTKPVAGEDIELGKSVEVKILAPNSEKYEDTNNYSIVVKLIYGKTSFLLEGDAESQSEEEMLSQGYDLKANVLKVSHHGSRTSSIPDFLYAVSPEYSVISVGKGNKFGHPHKQTLKKLKDSGMKIYRTDYEGTIIATSDGKKINFNVK